MTKTEFIAQLRKRQASFLKNKRQNGYKEGTVQHFRRTLEKFVLCFEEQYSQAIPPNIEQAKSVMPVFLDSINDRKKYAETIVSRFLKYLLIRNVISKMPKKAGYATEIEKERKNFISEYSEYLLRYRTLSPKSVKGYCSSFRIFMKFMFGANRVNFEIVNQEHLINFLIHRREAAPRHKSYSSHVRNFCDFLFWSGYIQEDLAKLVPNTRVNFTRVLPRHLNIEKIEQLISAAKDHPTQGRRNYAMCLLMAKLGLRATEIVELKLENIEFEDLVLKIKGKGNYVDEMPLTRKIADALKDYIENTRQGPSEYLFVSLRAPFNKLNDGQICQNVISEACAKTGIYPQTGYVGSHVFRHSVAVSLLENGATIETISNFLRHRSRQSTEIYARLDINQLRGLARNAPGD